MKYYRVTYQFAIAIALVSSSLACGGEEAILKEPLAQPVSDSFAGEISWVKTYGGSNEDNALSIVEAHDGGYLIAGYTQSTDGDITNKTASDSDFWLLKVDQDGALLWNKTYGGTSDDRAEKIIKTADGGYVVVGYVRSDDGDVSANAGLQDYWIFKIDGSGVIQWEKSFGFPGIDRAFSVVQTNDSGFFITGFLDVTASNGEGNDLPNKNKSAKHGVGEFWGIKLDASGNKEWRRYFGGSSNDRSYDVVETSDNGFIMIGSSESNDFDITNTNGSYDFWAVKVNAQGQKVWQKSFGGSEIDIAYAIAATGNGKYVIVGDVRSNDGDIADAKGNADLWMIQIDEKGSLIWQKTIGGSGFDTGRGIHKVRDGGLIITGNTRSNDFDIDINRGQSDILSLLVDNNGKIQWKTTFGGTNAEFGEDCIETQNKSILVVGNSESSDFDVPENKGSKDIILIKYK